MRFWVAAAGGALRTQVNLDATRYRTTDHQASSNGKQIRRLRGFNLVQRPKKAPTGLLRLALF
jgi:hypothetical protein